MPDGGTATVKVRVAGTFPAAQSTSCPNCDDMTIDPSPLLQEIKMTDHRAAFDHNKLLYQAQKNVTPLVLRDILVMKESINRMIPLLETDLGQCEVLSETLISLDHGDNCDACVLLRNIQLRYVHDLSLFQIHLKNSKLLWASVSKEDTYNAASAGSFLTLALNTRALLDNVFRSGVLFQEGDIRAYNKQIADSLTAFRNLEWSALSQNIGRNIDDVLADYQSLSISKRNNSDLYVDLAPTFKSKVDYFRQHENAVKMLPFLEDCERFYSAFSDMVHGGSAALAASNLKGGQIILGTGNARYVASAHQLAELIGVTLVLSRKLFTHLYLPLLRNAMLGIEGAEEIKERIEMTIESLSKSNSSFYF